MNHIHHYQRKTIASTVYKTALVIPLNELTTYIANTFHSKNGKYLKYLDIEDIIDFELCDIMVNQCVTTEPKIYVDLCDKHFVDTDVIDEIQDYVRQTIIPYLEKTWGILTIPVNIMRRYRNNSVLILPMEKPI